jgi:hypothetical protein
MSRSKCVLTIRSFLVSYVILCFLPCRICALQQFTRTEVGVTSSFLPGNRFSSASDFGIGGRFTYNLSSGFAIDSEIDSYLTNLDASQRSFQFGGRAVLGVLGVKAGIRCHKYGIFFKARPGVLSFAGAFSSSLFGPATTRITHAALDLGVASEFYPSHHAVLRLDIGTLLVRYGDATLFSTPTPTGTFTIRSTGIVGAPWHVAIGASYRLGHPLEEKEEPFHRPARLELGGEYSLLTLERSATTVRDESGFGGWAVWNFKKYVGLDSAVSFFPRQVRFADFQQGGRILQALVGLRSGVQQRHFGIFARFRPGLQLYTDTTQNETQPNLTHFANVAFDLGGSIEVYTSQHTLLRFDAGDTIIHYRARDIIAPDGTALHFPGFTNPTIQLTSGFGFRF